MIATPVIIGIGEFVDRSPDPTAVGEPIALMASALRNAEADSGAPVLGKLDRLSLVAQLGWRYADPVRLLCERLGIDPGYTANESVGGETPVRLVYQAAVAIAKGEATACAIVGGEAMNAIGKARKAKTPLPWTPEVSPEEVVKVAFRRLPLHRSAIDAGAASPVTIYPFYANAVARRLGQSPAEAKIADAKLWARFAAVAARNPSAWIRGAPDAERIGRIDESNRLIAFPYPKLMVANPSVNQAGAIIVANLEWARSLGVPDERMVFIGGGAFADEPGDFLERDRFDHSTAQAAVLDRVVKQAGGAENLDLAELYSCFPVVPRLALNQIGLRPDVEPTVAGGLTFFGGPINNYMTHAMCSAVRTLRGGEGHTALIYGQGGVVSKHFALLLSDAASAIPLAHDASVQAVADASRDIVPTVLESYAGPVTVESWTVVYAPDGTPNHGVVIGRTPEGDRLIARTRGDDQASLARLTDWDRSAVGAEGFVRIDAFGLMIFEYGGKRDRTALPRRYTTVERDGPVTIVTMNRPDQMNAIHPDMNEELSEIFDAFEADPDQWVAILTGAGDRAFSAGNDLKWTASAQARGERVRVPLSGFGGLTARWGMNKPVIAAVNGLAMGGGFEIALACDIIVAAETARFALPEVKVGLAAVAGGLLRLPRQIGLKQAAQMILTGRDVAADEAMRMGFVNQVVALDALLATAREWADRIVAASPMAVRASKEAIRKGLETADLKVAYDEHRNRPAMQALFRSDDVREGPRAFAEKRAPRWKGC